MEEHEDSEMGEAVAAKLRAGDRECYDKMQMLVTNALKTQNWVYGDMIMRIVWALLPGEAQEKISTSSSVAELDFCVVRTSPPDRSTPVDPQKRLHETLRRRVGTDVFTSWFRTLAFENFAEGVVTVSFPVRFLCTWVKSHYYDDFLTCCRTVFGDVRRVEFLVRSPGEPR